MSRTYPEPISERQQTPADALGTQLLAEFSDAKAARRYVEDRWMKSLRQYKGQYDPDVLGRIPKDANGRFLKSTVYIRHTKAKVDTLRARLLDLLFPSNNARNWGISPSPVSEIQPDIITEELQRRQQEGRAIPQDDREFLSEIAKERADRMAQTIDDQLNGQIGRLSYQRVCNAVINSGIIFGTGVLKGPLVEHRIKKQYARAEDGTWLLQPTQDHPYAPYYEHVPVHVLYPDPSASDARQMLYVWQTHLFTRRELMDLSKNPGFDQARILEYIVSNPEGDAEVTEHEQELRNLSDEQTAFEHKNRYRVLERWGYLTGSDLLTAGVDLETLRAAIPDFVEAGAYESCVWMTQGGTVIKAALSPVEGMAIPYHFFQPYKDDASFWPDGLPDVIRDLQTIINAAARMMIDNAAIACGPQIAVNVSALQNVEDARSVYPGKVWLFSTSEDLDRCFRSYDVSAHISELMAIGERFSQYSDEVSQPRYMSGDNSGVRGAGDTASGLSMLMNMASMPVKDIVRLFDCGITEPFIEDMYRWNMRFSTDESIKGDYEIMATGSTSLIAQELIGKRLMETMAVIASPQLSEATDFDALYSHILRAMDLPKDIKLSPEKAKQRRYENTLMEKQAQMESIIAECEKRGLPVPQVLQTVAAQIAGVQSPGDIQPVPGQQAMLTGAEPSVGGEVDAA